jgi:prepilin-type N-terminal cleavage/methylation domain-containing protein
MRQKTKQSGFSLIEVMVSIGILGIGISAIGFVVTQTFAMQEKSDLARKIGNYRTGLIAALDSDLAWRMTTKYSGNAAILGCLDDSLSVPCTSPAPTGLIAVMNGSAQTVFDSTRPTAGFKKTGDLCDAFNPLTGNSDCPLRYNITSKIICPAVGPCSQPEVEVSGQLAYKGGPGMPQINTQKYDFKHVRGITSNTLYKSCISLGGRFMLASGECTLPWVGDCPVGQFVVGVSHDATTLNQKICKPFVGLCPGQTILVGMQQNGTPNCVATCGGIAPLIAGPVGIIPLPPDPGMFGGGGDGDGCDGDGDGC